MRLFRAKKIFGRSLFSPLSSNGRRRCGRGRSFTIEPLESRMMLHGDPATGPHDHPPEYDPENFHIHAQLTISIDGEIVDIPANIGIGPSGFLSQTHTHDADNVLHLHNIADAPPPEDFLTLGHFFDTWRTNAGVAGNNPDALLTSTQILGHTVDDENPLRMFVNGIETTEFEDYEVHGGDNIVLVYGANPVLTLETNQGPILVELFPDVAPGTVDNFLNYVNDGDYTNSIFHRLVPGFVLQGGGFSSAEEAFTDTAQFEPVPTDPPIPNEPDLSNLRGTLAMAKLGGSPDSATSQWFVNLGDNSENLDNQNGGFTVFGQVLGMWTGREDVLPSTVDAIANFTTSDEGGTFTDLPLDDQDNVVRIESIDGEGAVRGTVFVDANGNQAFDSGETALEDVTVFADANQNGVLDAGEASTISDVDGNYVLRVEAGTHVVRQVVEDPFFQTAPLSPDFHTVTVQIGREETDVDFANADLGTNGDTFEVDEDSQDVELDVLANDVLNGSDEGLTIAMVGTPDQNGTVTIAEDGLSLRYTPAADFFGAETFTYQVTDGETSEEATVVVLVQPVNDPPTAVDDEFTINKNETVTLSVLDNDLTEPDSGEALRVRSVITPQDPPDAGTAMIGDDGQSILYSPPEDFVGTIVLTYQISDRPGNGLTSDASVTVNIVDITANPDTLTVAEDSQGNELDVLANDTIEPDLGETLTIAAIDASSLIQGSSLTISEDSLRLIYTPAADFFGTETFTYTVSDGRGGTAQGTGTLTVTPVNDPPHAVDDSFTFTTDTGPHTLDVLANDTVEPDEDETLTITGASVPQEAGTVQILDDGERLEYTPADGFAGDAVITYAIDDGNGGTDEATATVTIREFVPSSLAGFVYFDRNDDGVMDSSEAAIGGVTITLAGTDSFGEDVDRTTTTAADGSYLFADLAPGTYTVSQSQPALVLDGRETIGSQGGQAADNQFTIELEEGVTGAGNNFGELGRSAEIVGLMDFFAIRSEPLVMSATDGNGQAWYSARDDWSSFNDLTVELAEDLSDVEVTLTYSSDTQESVTAPIDGTRATIIRQNGDATLVGLLVDSMAFGFTPPDTGGAMAAAADELASQAAAEIMQAEAGQTGGSDAEMAAALLGNGMEQNEEELPALDAAFEEFDQLQV